MYSLFIIQLNQQRMCSVILNDTLIVARVVNKSPTVYGIQMLFSVFKIM